MTRTSSLRPDFATNLRQGVGAGVSYIGKRPIDIYGTYTLPSSTRLDAALYWNPAEAISVTVNVINLTKERTFDSVFGSPLFGITERAPCFVKFSGSYRF